MIITKNLFNEDSPQYESAAEQRAAIEAYLRGDFGELTLLEIEYIRKIERDRHLDKFAATHAGQIAADVDPAYLAGMRFVFGNAILSVPHPITNWYLYHLELELQESANDSSVLDRINRIHGIMGQKPHR